MPTLQNEIFTRLVDAFEATLRGISPRLYWKIMPRLAEEMNLYYRDDVKTAGITFYTASEVGRTRAETLLTKEPDTIEWLNGFQSGETLWDIGANIGVYSLYAAVKRGVRVLAFEPSPFNFYALCRNVHANGLGQQIQPFMVALGKGESIDRLYMSENGTGIGGAGNSFKQNVDNHGSQFDAALTQYVIGTSIDSFIETYGAAFPTHIKIDVDGNQEDIARGMTRTLADPRLKSVMFELLPDQPDVSKRIDDLIIGAGFRQKKIGNVKSANNFYFR